MKHFSPLSAFVFLSFSAFAGSTLAQTIDTSVCEILTNPQLLDGKTVRIRGTIIAGFDEFAVKNAGGCSGPASAIWLTYPEGTKAKAGPAAFLQVQLGRNNPATPRAVGNRHMVKLDRNANFNEFDSLLSTPVKLAGTCLGCVRYTAAAILVGRIDGMKNAGLVRGTTGKVVAVNGFGNMNRYAARLVLQSVSDVTSQELDYTKAATSKDDSPHRATGADPVADLRLRIAGFGPGSREAIELERAAAAFGKSGEDNGVEIGFGLANEIPRNDGAHGERNSPDGVLFNCTFDTDRLKGDALTAAIAHVGTHVADIRDAGPAGAQQSLYDLEYRAWLSTVAAVAADPPGELVLPGGYVATSNSPNITSKMVDDLIARFLVDWAGFSKPLP
jgi:hypothetical protein